MRKILLKKFFQNEGMALFTVLAVMMLLLMLSLGIVTLATGNLRTVGNISSRLQALNLAEAASMYALYEIQSSSDPNSSLWAPGYAPTPPASSLTFTSYDPIPYSNLNGLPGRCSVAYVKNLYNTNATTAISPGGSFASFVSSTIDVPEEGVVILAQGEYEGFRRTIKTTLKYGYYGSVADGTITLSDGLLVLNGIRNIPNDEPFPGSLYAKKGFSYNNLSGYKFLNGSKLVTAGNAPPPPASGTPVPSSFFDTNKPAVATVNDWSIGDPNVTGGAPSDPNKYALFVPDANTATDPAPASVPIIVRPSFSSPSPATIKYKYTGLFDVQNDTFVDGSLEADQLRIIDNKKLFVNGTLTTHGAIWLGQNVSLFVSGYYGDPNCTDPNFSYGLAMEADGLAVQCATSPAGACALFTDGDIKFNSLPTYTPPSGVSVANVDAWLKAAPLDTNEIIDIFKMIRISGTLSSDLVWNWYLDSTSGDPNFVSRGGRAGKHLLSGCTSCRDYLINDKGLKPVPQEIIDWFNSPYTDDGFKWATELNGAPPRWGAFGNNPSLCQTACDTFIGAVIYTYGTVTTEGSPFPIRIIGGIIAKNKSTISPNPTPTDPNTSHGGNIKLANGSSIILYPASFRSGIPIVRPIFTPYSWEELY